MGDTRDRLAIAAAAVYVLMTGWSMATFSYDIWGAFVVAPVILLVSVPLLRRIFTGEHARLFPIAVVGLVAHLGGSFLRYWVAFDAYGGSADSSTYDAVGKQIAADVLDGRTTLASMVPRGTGTEFIGRLTGAVYTLLGASRLGGFLVFGWLAFWGMVLFVHAALLGVQQLSSRFYAALVLLSPSLIYWPTSIGKESWLCLSLGALSYGGARVLTGRWGGMALPVVVAGLWGASSVRPHLAGIWLGALAIALGFGLVTQRSGSRHRERLATIGLAGLSLLMLFVVASATLRYLNAGADSSDTATVTQQVNDIFTETSRRSTQGGSSFQPVSISSPLDWPLAIGRTLTRPLLPEARSFAELLPALEMTGLFVLAALSCRRLLNLPRVALRNPYVVFAMLCLLMFGLVFASIGNLGILTRQRSLVVPFLVLPFCVPRASTVEKVALPATFRSAGRRPASSSVSSTLPARMVSS